MNSRLYMTVRFPPLICGTQYLERRQALNPGARLVAMNTEQVRGTMDFFGD
jgi:hypothetical protein